MEADVNTAANVLSIGQIIYTVYKEKQHHKGSTSQHIKQLQNCLKDTWKEASNHDGWQSQKEVPNEFSLDNKKTFNNNLESIQKILDKLSPVDSKYFKSTFTSQRSLDKYKQLDTYLNKLGWCPKLSEMAGLF